MVGALRYEDPFQRYGSRKNPRKPRKIPRFLSEAYDSHRRAVFGLVRKRTRVRTAWDNTRSSHTTDRSFRKGCHPLMGNRAEMMTVPRTRSDSVKAAHNRTRQRNL